MVPVAAVQAVDEVPPVLVSEPARARGGSAATRPRIPVLDQARGLFLLWMLTAHALTLAGVPRAHWLQMLRPYGWSTFCFVMLIGWRIAISDGASANPAGVERSL